MASFYKVPLQAAPQKFTIVLSGVTYTLTMQYRNTLMGGWILDIGDANNNPILQGIPLVTGVNLLDQYAYLGFVGALWVQTTTDPDEVPTYENLGTDGNVYYVTNP
jgi:predicted Zn-dependent protease with MMP-like domain